MSPARFLASSRAFPLLALLAVILTFSQTPNFISVANLENILRSVPVLLLVAVGLSLVIVAGSIDISVAGIISLSGVVGALVVPHLGEAGLLLGIPVGILVGLANGLIVARLKLPSFLVTLGMWFVLQGLSQLISGGVPIPYTGPVSAALWSHTVPILGLHIGYMTLIALFLVGIAVVFARGTRAGHYIYAVGGGESAAELAGIKVAQYKVLVFVICGLLAAVAGIMLTTRAQAATPTQGQSFLLDAIAAVVIGGTSLLGGIGGPHYAVLGTLVILLLDDGMVLAGINPDFEIIIRGLVIIVASAITLRRIGGVIK